GVLPDHPGLSLRHRPGRGAGLVALEHGDRHHGRVLAGRGAARARGVPRHATARFRPGLHRARDAGCAHHLPPHPAQLPCSHHRAGHQSGRRGPERRAEPPSPTVDVDPLAMERYASPPFEGGAMVTVMMIAETVGHRDALRERPADYSAVARRTREELPYAAL